MFDLKVPEESYKFVAWHIWILPDWYFWRTKIIYGWAINAHHYQRLRVWITHFLKKGEKLIAKSVSVNISCALSLRLRLLLSNCKDGSHGKAPLAAEKVDRIELLTNQQDRPSPIDPWQCTWQFYLCTKWLRFFFQKIKNLRTSGHFYQTPFLRRTKKLFCVLKLKTFICFEQQWSVITAEMSWYQTSFWEFHQLLFKIFLCVNYLIALD